jgi:hypothetical protein
VGLLVVISFLDGQYCQFWDDLMTDQPVESVDVSEQWLGSSAHWKEAAVSTTRS